MRRLHCSINKISKSHIQSIWISRRLQNTISIQSYRKTSELHRIIPNIGGPPSSKGQISKGVIHSVLEYAATNFKWFSRTIQIQNFFGNYAENVAIT